MTIIIIIGVTIFLVSAAFLGLGCLLVQKMDNELLGGTIVCIGIFLAATSLVFTPYVHFHYKSAEVKARLINAKYGTNYTAEDLFWAPEMVQKIIIIRTEQGVLDENKRIEVEIE